MGCPQMYVFEAVISFFIDAWAASSEGLTLGSYSMSQISSIPVSYAEELDEVSGLESYPMPSGHSTIVGKSAQQTDVAPFAIFNASGGTEFKDSRMVYGFSSPVSCTIGTQSSNSENGDKFSTPGQSSSTLSPKRSCSTKERRQPPCIETEEIRKRSWKMQQPLQMTLDTSMNPVQPRNLRRRTKQQQSVTNIVRRLKACEYHRRAKKMVLEFTLLAAYFDGKLNISFL